MYNYKQVANYFIGKAIEEKEELTPMKLQKLLYYAHGWYLALVGDPLLSEPIQAWRYGPVISNLYQDLKMYGNQNITQPILDFDGENFYTPVIPTEDVPTRNFLDAFWKKYKPFSAYRLSNATHLKDSPWSKAIEKQQSFIDNSTIKAYFCAQIPSNG